MTEPFSTNDIYYTSASSCDTYTSTGCNNEDGTDTGNCECKYKENVDKLNKINASSGLTKEQYDDSVKSRNRTIMNTVSLGIGIVGMMWMMYSSQ
jgi:hypothetical protein